MTIDLVLIDDDPLIALAWEMAAKKARRTLVTYDHPGRFMAEASKIPPHVPIYVDCHIGPFVRGEAVSREIKDLGFQKVFLATGLPAATFDQMDWLDGIVGKEPPPLLVG